MQDSWSIHYPRIGKPFDLEQLLVSSESDLANSSPFLQSDGDTPRDELSIFATVKKVFVDPEALGWEKMRHDNGEVTYVIAVCVKVSRSDDRIRLGIKVCNKAAAPTGGTCWMCRLAGTVANEYIDSQEEQLDATSVVWLDEEEVIWEADSSHLALPSNA